MLYHIVWPLIRGAWVYCHKELTSQNECDSVFLGSAYVNLWSPTLPHSLSVSLALAFASLSLSMALSLAPLLSLVRRMFYFGERPRDQFEL